MAISGIVFYTASAYAAGYWILNSFLYEVFVLKTMDVGAPRYSSDHVKDIARMMIESEGVDLGTLLVNENYLQGTWHATESMILSC